MKIVALEEDLSFLRSCRHGSNWIHILRLPEPQFLSEVEVVNASWISVPDGSPTWTRLVLTYRSCP